VSFASRRGSVPHRHRTSKGLTLLGAAALYLFGALPAVAQEPDPLSKLDPTSRKQIELTLDSAEAEGIPARPILLKAYEGIVKHAADRKIVAEVKKKFMLLRVARAQLGGVDEGELDAAAGPRGDGVSAHRR